MSEEDDKGCDGGGPHCCCCGPGDECCDCGKIMPADYPDCVEPDEDE